MTRSLLIKLRRRLLAQAFAHAFAWSFLVMAGLFTCVVGFGPRLAAGSQVVLAVGATLLAALGAAIWTIWRQPSLQEVAAKLDRAAATHDRLSTALAFEAAPPDRSLFHQAALAECQKFLSGFDGRRWTPWQMPRALPWLCVPVLAFGLLQFLDKPATGPLKGEADPAALAAAERLEEMARKLEEKRKDSPDMKKVAEAIKKSAAQLRTEAEGQSPDKAMLRELSAIEDLLKAAQQGNDMEALAATLAQMDQAKAAAEAAEALKQRDAASAAAKLEELGKRLAEESASQNGEKQLQQLEKAMAGAAQKLGEQSPLGAAASKASAAGKRRDGAGAQQAMEQMSEALRQANSNRSGQGQKSQESKELAAMIQALREMKSGQGGKPGDESGSGDGQKTLVISPSGKGNGQGEPMPGMGDSASGQPGSERDEGTKASPYGAESAPPAAAEMQTQIQGLLGEGESLNALIPAKPGEEPAKTGYKALYEAAAPAAEDALEKENIPLGSRLFVKRYFESIRPKQ